MTERKDLLLVGHGRNDPIERTQEEQDRINAYVNQCGRPVSGGMIKNTNTGEVTHPTSTYIGDLQNED